MKNKKITALILSASFFMSTLPAIADVGDASYTINTQTQNEDGAEITSFNLQNLYMTLVGETDKKTYSPNQYDGKKIIFSNLPKQKYKVKYQIPHQWSTREDKTSAKIPSNVDASQIVFGPDAIITENKNNASNVDIYMSIYNDTNVPFVKDAYKRDNYIEGYITRDKSSDVREKEGTLIRLFTDNNRVIAEERTKHDGTFSIHLDSNYDNERLKAVAIDKAGNQSGYYYIDYYTKNKNGYTEFRTNEQLDTIREGDTQIKGRMTVEYDKVTIYINKKRQETVTPDRQGYWSVRVPRIGYNDLIELEYSNRRRTVTDTIKIGDNRYQNDDRRWYTDERGDRYYYDRDGKRVYENRNNGTRIYYNDNGKRYYYENGRRVYDGQDYYDYSKSYIYRNGKAYVDPNSYRYDNQGRRYIDDKGERYYYENGQVYVYNNGIKTYINQTQAPLVFQNSTPQIEQNNNQYQPKSKIDVTNLFGGYADGQLHLERYLTRAEFATILNKARNASSLLPTNQKQVPYDARNHWANSAIQFAVQSNLIGGYPDGTFKPDKLVTRAEVSAILARFAGITPQKTNQSFYDVGSHHWAKDVISTMRAMNIINGYPDGSFKPEMPITRQELLFMLQRL